MGLHPHGSNVIFLGPKGGIRESFVEAEVVLDLLDEVPPFDLWVVEDLLSEFSEEALELLGSGGGHVWLVSLAVWWGVTTDVTPPLRRYMLDTGGTRSSKRGANWIRTPFPKCLICIVWVKRPHYTFQGLSFLLLVLMLKQFLD